MVVRQSWQFGREEGFEELARLAVDSFKSPTTPYLNLDLWMKYHAVKNAVLFDPRSVPEPLEKLWIDPDDVQYRPRYGYFDRISNIGSVRGGDWDRSDASIEDHPTYRGLRQRFVEGRAWEDTAYFEHNAERIESGRVEKGCSTVEEFLNVRCPYVDDLFAKIEENGYKPQEELGASAIDANRYDPKPQYLRTNEVGINVGRDGQLLMNSGYHRISIAKILDLQAIPVHAIVRHRGWQQVREEIAVANGDASLSAHVQSHLGHPDLVDVRAETHHLTPSDVVSSAEPSD